MAQNPSGPFRIKRGVTQPVYRRLLLQTDGKTPWDLSLADHANFVMQLRGQSGPAVDALATIVQQGDAVTGTDVGWAEYDWIAGDTDMTGVYDAEFALYDADGNVYARVPSDGYLEIQVLGNLSDVGVVPPPPTVGDLPVIVDLVAYHGDAWSQPFRFLSDGNPVDLTGATVAATAAHGSASYSLPVTVDDPTNGHIVLSMPTPPIPAGAYSYDVEDQTDAKTWVRGRLVVVQDVTQ